MRSARFPFRDEPEKKEAHRGSVMPEYIDPLFLAALREVPEDAKDEDLPARARKVGAI